MSERCPVCFHFQQFCNCPAVVEAERIVRSVQLNEWLRPMDLGVAPAIPLDYIKRWFDLRDDDWY